MESNETKNLEELLKKIPGFTKRQINKTITYFLDNPENAIDDIFAALKALKKAMQKCEICNQFNQNHICEICQDNNRSKKLMVVENSNDIAKFETLNIFDGKYFVLEGIYDLKKPDEKVIKNIEKLLALAKSKSEITLALPATIEGQFTMQYLQKLLRDKIAFTNVFQLSMGIPVGSSVEYVDPITLKQSLINKTKVS
ncbi:toprim domain-containing protein [Metamycoplasma neophronis]|uniref:Recombination protein RecR n=1 Tax=Metamycoplasma neophronis TaxID=872983 RepID=A0ABY2Z3I8_9BACT|nr:toprim domain-containing protein [Metamycoplasma neophronis]TPR53367.1 recombination protein RecR [Metamycoplasma neophronis]